MCLISQDAPFCFSEDNVSFRVAEKGQCKYPCETGKAEIE